MQFPPVDWGKINVIAIVFIGQMQPYGSLWFLSYVTICKLLKYWIKGGGVTFYRNCGAASVVVKQDNLILSAEVINKCKLATVKIF